MGQNQSRLSDRPGKLGLGDKSKGQAVLRETQDGHQSSKECYQEWHVVDREKNCQAEADRHNKAIKGFEQEHIDDAAKVFNGATGPNAKLSQVIKLEFCADNEDDAVKKGTAAINKVSEDARKSYQAMADKRDASGHVDTINCGCAPH